MAIDLRTTIPRLNPACNVRTLPLGPEEGFVLSRVDGVTTAADIGAMTGLGAEVLGTLQKLASLGALLDVPGAPPPASPPPPPPTAAPAEEAPRRRRTGPPKYTQAELDEVCELDLARKQRILELFYDLAVLSHYEILGVPTSADKKAVKSAYFKLAPEFHPDKFFRKELGNFKPKMEAVFARITEAEQVLTRKEPRAEYDAYLTQRQQTEEIEALLRGDVEPPPDPKAPVVSSIPPPTAGEPEAQPAIAVGGGTRISAWPLTGERSSVTPAAPTAGAAPQPTPARSPSASQQGAPRSDDERLRRQALAAKLSSGRFPTRTPAPPPPPIAAPAEDPLAAAARQKAAGDSLRRMFVSKKHEGAREQIDRYLKAAEDAVAQADTVGAANAYRLASAHHPTDDSLAGLSREWSAKAATVLAAGYLKQGEYEAREARWTEAARSLGRAAAGMPLDAKVLAMAAHAILKAGGDLHQAADLAKRAVELSPANVELQVTLAEVYLGANLPLAARRVLDAASKAAPKDSKVRALLDRLR